MRMILESTVQSNGDWGREVKTRLQAWWSGWRRVSGVIYDRWVPARLNGKVYSRDTSNVVQFGGGGTDEKTGGGAGGRRVEDAKIFAGSDEDGQDQE